jgi:hypothetical protein
LLLYTIKYTHISEVMTWTDSFIDHYLYYAMGCLVYLFLLAKNLCRKEIHTRSWAVINFKL